MDANKLKPLIIPASLQKLHDEAKLSGVPIIFDAGLAFVRDILLEENPKEILEIGTAVGYSACYMHILTNANITTIERNDAMINWATNTFKKMGFNDSIRLITLDAKEAYETVKDRKYDVLFIDAAKASYQTFFETFSPLLSEKGIIVCDNMDFHGLVDSDTTGMTRSVRGLARKLKRFQDYLENNPEFETTLYHIGDGISVSRRKQ